MAYILLTRRFSRPLSRRLSAVIILHNKLTYITKEELEIPRSAAEVRPWVDAILEEISKTEEGRQAVRFREGYLKELTEEALPLGIFCEHYFNSSHCVTLNHLTGNQNYDVKITDKRLKQSPLKYLEITQAHEGEDAHLRMIKLKEEGHANAFGKVKKIGTKHTGLSIEIENEAIEHGELVRKELKRIHEAANRKKGKVYPEGTGLIIICDDYVAFRKPEDIVQLNEYIKNNVLPGLDNFTSIFVIGWSSKIFLEFD